MILHKRIHLVLVALGLTLFMACDKDFNSIGANIIGDGHYTFGTPDHEATVLAYNHDISSVQSNNLPVNPLGIYHNTTFGKSTAHFVTQLSLPTAIPTFTTITQPPLVEDVVLYIPYFSVKGTTTNEVTSYTLDSIYGNSKLKLSVYENGFLLRDFDPETGSVNAQKYYTDQVLDFENNKRGAAADGTSVANGERLNNSTNTAQNDEFFFDATEISVVSTNDAGDETTTKLAPGIYLKLNSSFFQKKIIEGSAQGQLANNNVFKNYFRGLYFKVEQAASAPNGSSLAMLNFANGKVTIKYKEDKAVENQTNPDRVTKTLELNLSGNTVSLVDQNRNMDYANALAGASETTGDDRLYVNGGPGSMAVIELFGRDANGLSAELEAYRAKGWLINEANLTFTIDRDALGTNPEPNRLYLYDLNNNRPLIDYTADQTTNTAKPKLGKRVYGGIIVKQNNRGVTYKFKITNHISNLLRNPDSTNVRLGLVTTEAIGTVANYSKKNPGSSFIKRVPTASVMNPLGTVLFGSKSSIPLDKRLRLEIYYTKPD